MSDRVFLDTNVLVYLFDRDAPDKQARSREILTEPARLGKLVISTQVLQELYVVLTRKLKPRVPEDEAGQAVRDFATLTVVPVDKQMVLAAVERSQRHSVSLWDAMIVQAAIEAACESVYSEDMGHGQKMDGVLIENPFRSPLAS